MRVFLQILAMIAVFAAFALAVVLVYRNLDDSIIPTPDCYPPHCEESQP